MFSNLQSRFLLSAFVVSCIIFCLPTMTTALPMKDVIGKAMMTAKMEQQQQQQQQHRQKRAVTKTDCAQPSDLEAMFQQLNSQLTNTQFLQNTVNNQAITIPASEKPKIIANQGVDRTCPAAVNRTQSAPLESRSLCPYFFDVLQMPEGYYPPTLPAAQCRCQQCLEQTTFGCEKVFTPIAVLKPVGCFQGLQRYEEEVFQVATSCTCAYNGAMAQPPTTTTTASPGWGVQ